MVIGFTVNKFKYIINIIELNLLNYLKIIIFKTKIDNTNK